MQLSPKGAQLRACLSPSAGCPIYLRESTRIRLGEWTGEQMWTDRHQTRHATRLKDMVLQAGLDEVARFLKRADPPGRLDATERRVRCWRGLPGIRGRAEDGGL